jgi:hypothetical protein
MSTSAQRERDLVHEVAALSIGTSAQRFFEQAQHASSPSPQPAAHKRSGA